MSEQRSASDIGDLDAGPAADRAAARDTPPAVDAGPAIPVQPASLDIWQHKYRLRHKDGTPVDADFQATYARVARALADCERTPAAREQWYERFVWALNNGAIPAGRIISNAGAGDYKPATSTINPRTPTTRP